MIGDSEARLTPLAQVHPHGTLNLDGSVVSIGSFDGVHHGHQELLKTLSRAAAGRGVASVVYTFDPPPKTVFAGALQLTDGEEKVRRISHFGIDHIILARFDRDYAARPPEDFLRELARLNPREVWVGEDFRFGHKRAGDVEMLARAFRVRVIDTFACHDGDRISSTRLRECFARGRWQEAAALHGWPETARWAFSGDAEPTATPLT